MPVPLAEAIQRVVLPLFYTTNGIDFVQHGSNRPLSACCLIWQVIDCWSAGAFETCVCVYVLQLLLLFCSGLTTYPDHQNAHHKRLKPWLLTYFLHQPCSVRTVNIGTPHWQHNLGIPLTQLSAVRTAVFTQALQDLC